MSTENFAGRNPIYTPAIVAERSDLIASLIKKAGETMNVSFLDIRPTLRKVAYTTPIHGPKDWNHFNKEGLSGNEDCSRSKE